MDVSLPFMGVLDVGTAHSGLMFACCVVVPGCILLLLFFVPSSFIPVLGPIGICLVLQTPFVGIEAPYIDVLW